MTTSEIIQAIVAVLTLLFSILAVVVPIVLAYYILKVEVKITTKMEGIVAAMTSKMEGVVATMTARHEALREETREERHDLIDTFEATYVRKETYAVELVALRDSIGIKDALNRIEQLCLNPAHQHQHPHTP